MITTETVIRHRPATTSTDAGGNTVVVSWDDEPLTVAVAPRESTESRQPGRAPVVDGLTIYGDALLDIDARDEITARGQRWAVEGDTATWTPPVGFTVGGAVVNLRRVRG